MLQIMTTGKANVLFPLQTYEDDASKKCPLD